MNKIDEGIYQLEKRGVNFYLCLEEEEITLIDAGYPKSAQVIWQALAELGKQPTDLTRILITHADIDHVGGLKDVQSQSGAEVWCGAETAVHLRTATPPKHLPKFAEFLSRFFVKFDAVTDVNHFQHNEVLPVLGGLQVIATAGHTPDHHSFYSPTRGILFAGDALNMRSGTLQASPSIISADITAVARSAIQLLNLSPAIIACGHGSPLTGHSTDDLMALFSQLRTES